jgi:hypothetical protein
MRPWRGYRQFYEAGMAAVRELWDGYVMALGVPKVVAPIRLGELVVAEQVKRAGAGIAVSFSETTPGSSPASRRAGWSRLASD